jgi:hypothetical protein
MKIPDITECGSKSLTIPFAGCTGRIGMGIMDKKEMKSILEKSQDNVWDKLTEDQKKDIILSYEESEIEIDLIENESVMNIYKNWL